MPRLIPSLCTPPAPTGQGFVTHLLCSPKPRLSLKHTHTHILRKPTSDFYAWDTSACGVSYNLLT